MTSFSLKKLFKKLNDYDIKLTHKELAKVKELTKDEINHLLKNRYLEEAISIIIDEDFQQLDLDTRCKIIDLLNNCQDSFDALAVKFTCLNNSVIASGLIIELAEIISKSTCLGSSWQFSIDVAVTLCSQKKELAVSLTKIICNSIGESQTYWAYRVATDSNVLASGKVLELTEIVSKSLGKTQAEYAYKVATNSNALASDLTISLTQIISESIDKAQIWGAYKVATDSNVLASGKALELAEIMIKSLGKTQASYAASVALHLSVLKSELVVPLTRIISKSIGLTQAECAYRVAMNQNALQSGFVLELTEIISQIKEEYVESAYDAVGIAINEYVLASDLAVDLTKIVCESAEGTCAAAVAKNLSVLDSGLAKELTTLVGNAIGEFQARWGLRVATNNVVLFSGKALEVTRLFCNASNLDNMEPAYEIAINHSYITRSDYLEMLNQALVPILDPNQNNDNNEDFIIGENAQIRVRALPTNKKDF